jgi:hypothetical protein
MEQDLLFSMSQTGVVNGVAIDLMVMGGVMWGSTCLFVYRYSMPAI